MDAFEQPARWENLARLLRHPLREVVLLKYTEGVTSPSAIAAALGEPLNVVSYHTRVLLDGGVLELVRTEPRRGAREHFYRATLPGLIEDADWGRLPVVLRRVLVRHMIEAAVRDAADAVPAGGMDGATTHMSRNYFNLDRQGRGELASLLRETFERATEIAQASRRRGADNLTAHELVIMSFIPASRP
jgi:DNA-binding transcriptional ArsR family regulator